MEVRTFLFSGYEWKLAPRECARAIGANGESIVAEVLEDHNIEYHFTPYHHPIDIVARGYGIEIKTCTKDRRIYLSRKTRRKKREYCKKNHLQGIVVVVYLQRREQPKGWRYPEDIVDIRYKEGFRSFDINRMRDFQEWLDAIDREIQATEEV